MNPTLAKAVAIVTFALIFYSIAVITEQRKSSISKSVLIFLALGVVFDVSSTSLMIIGAGAEPVSIHGFIGYSALLVMLVDAALIWRSWRKNKEAKVSRKLNLYTRFAYCWWVVAYIAGAVIAMTLK